MPCPTKPVRVLRAGQGPVFVAKLTADGKYLLTGGQDRTVRLWNPARSDSTVDSKSPLEAAVLIKSYTGTHSYEIRDIAVAADNSKFASCGGDKNAFICEVAIGTIKRLQGHDSMINACAANADFTVLMTASYDRSIKAWDLRAPGRQPIQTLEGCKDSVTSVLVAPSGTEVIAGCVDGRVRTYDLRAGALFEDDLHEPVTSISVSNDGNCLLASCLGSGTIRMLERQSGVQLNAFRGHLNASYPLQSCFSNTDAQVLSGSEDGSVVVWDLMDAKVLARLKHHTKPTCAIAYHPKETMMVTASYDGTAVVWE
jgi:mitogen-activated protein kinase organizer 1